MVTLLSPVEKQIPIVKLTELARVRIARSLQLTSVLDASMEHGRGKAPNAGESDREAELPLELSGSVLWRRIAAAPYSPTPRTNRR